MKESIKTVKISAKVGKDLDLNCDKENKKVKKLPNKEINYIKTIKIPASVANILKIKAAPDLTNTVIDTVTNSIDSWVKKNVNSLDGWVNRDEELSKLSDSMIHYFNEMKKITEETVKSKKAKKEVKKTNKKIKKK